jgi:hypothetical protein
MMMATHAAQHTHCADAAALTSATSSSKHPLQQHPLLTPIAGWQRM